MVRAQRKTHYCMGNLTIPHLLRRASLSQTQSNRSKRICSYDEDFQEQSVVLKDRFRQCGYKDGQNVSGSQWQIDTPFKNMS